jgi:hypothetical protein
LREEREEFEFNRGSKATIIPAQKEPLLGANNFGDYDSESDSSADAVVINKMVKELVDMGFSRLMAEALFKHEEVIEDTNHAVELLIQGPNGWIHKFARSPLNSLCYICKGQAMDHLSERLRV